MPPRMACPILWTETLTSLTMQALRWHHIAIITSILGLVYATNWSVYRPIISVELAQEVVIAFGYHESGRCFLKGTDVADNNIKISVIMGKLRRCQDTASAIAAVTETVDALHDKNFFEAGRFSDFHLFGLNRAAHLLAHYQSRNLEVIETWLESRLALSGDGGPVR